MKEHKYDVIVAGAGTAGICAGLSAARSGAHVLMIEKNSYCGGTAASGLPFVDFFSVNGVQLVKGIAEELVNNLYREKESVGHIKTSNGHLHSITMIDPEWVKIIMEDMLVESRCEILYHSFICSAKVSNNRIRSITVANKEGLSEYSADCFVDATGDGDLFAFSHANYEKGRELDGLCQAMSLIFRLGNIDVEKVSSLFSLNPIIAKPLDGNHSYNLHMSGTLDKWSYALAQFESLDKHYNFWAGTTREGELTYVNSIHVNGKDATDPFELSKAEIEGRKQLREFIKFLRLNIPGMERAYISSTANGIGVRETRRIKGELVLTEEDVLRGKHFRDVIARNGYCIDIHDPKGNGWSTRTILSQEGYYDIPYRCLIPEKLNGLLVAGRCISVTSGALASTRIMPCCMALGQAAGIAASMCVEKGIVPRQVDVIELQEKLRKEGACIG